MYSNDCGSESLACLFSIQYNISLSLIQTLQKSGNFKKITFGGKFPFKNFLCLKIIRKEGLVPSTMQVETILNPFFHDLLEAGNGHFEEVNMLVALKIGPATHDPDASYTP
uniref:Uncharacterized protein n=1 Tax=Rhizophagus irregularis (strain DAOM 181602 / DAOM 197198 / MUCL 43194) TaxID=747089 RepID=U9UUA7_RHIID